MTIIAPPLGVTLALAFLLPQVLLDGAEAAADCQLRVPPNPLTAQGLATPYQMTGCDMAGDTPSFVEAVIFDPATKRLSVYPPLVVNAGTSPAVMPTPPQLPPNAVVGLWFGTNGDTLTLTGPGVAAGNCVNGLGRSIFGQFAYCNAPAFFAAAAAGGVRTPALGTGADRMTCPTTRDFGLVDMDPSDNVVTTYLLTRTRQTCQNTNANRRVNPGAVVLINGSDNQLLNAVDRALNCQRFTAPDLADPGAQVNALALNELQASQQQRPPVALVQDDDPMTLVNNRPNLRKRNLYRAGVDQPPNVPQTAQTFCQNLRAIAPARYLAGQQFTQRAPSPDPATGSNLFTFLCARFETTYGADGLNCAGLLRQASPFRVTKQGDVVTTCALAQPAGANNVKKNLGKAKKKVGNAKKNLGKAKKKVGNAKKNLGNVKHLANGGKGGKGM